MVSVAISKVGYDSAAEWRTPPSRRSPPLNPLFAAIDVVQAPLLGVTTAAKSWIVVLIITVLGRGISFAVFARLRARIA